MARDNTAGASTGQSNHRYTRSNPFKAIISGTKTEQQPAISASPSKSLTRKYLTRSQSGRQPNDASTYKKGSQPLGEINNLQDVPSRKTNATQAEPRPKSLHKRTKSALSLKGLKGKIWDDSNDSKDEEPQEHPLKSLKHSKRSKSSTSLSAFLSRPKSKGRDAAGQKSKQADSNDPLNAGEEPPRAPIWAQFSSNLDEVASTYQSSDRCDGQDAEAAFEAVLESRNVPSDVRQKMRTLDAKLKAEFVRQHRTGSPTKPPGQNSAQQTSSSAKRTRGDRAPSNEDVSMFHEDGGSPKKSRPRSFQLPLNMGGQSPTKKHKSGKPSGHGRNKSVDLPRSASSNSIASQFSTHNVSGSVAGSRHTTPEEFISYLRKAQKPQSVEVGKLQRLRQLLRNETVEWVDTFINSGGMEDVVNLLYGIIAIEWREEHDDSLLHHALNCVKALATTDKGLEHLSVLQEKLFPTLIKLLFSAGDERKAPSEYTTRELIMSLFFAFLRAGPSFTPAERAEMVLSYLRDPEQDESARPPGFIMTMHKPRPYKLWHVEFSSVTKEVFWIFLHPVNVIPYPAQPQNHHNEAFQATTAGASAYRAAHFPAPRAPVAAAPYVGGVEWEATNYLAAHLDVLNGALACLPTRDARNAVRAELRDSGFERVMGASLRTCKQKFYGGVHEALATFVGAGRADGWDVRMVREGPTREERSRASPGKVTAAQGGGNNNNKGGKENRPPLLGEIKVDAGPRLQLQVRNPDIGLENW